MEEEDRKRLATMLEERTMKLMERESELADKFEELESQKEELTAAVEELFQKNKQLTEKNQELDQILYRASHDLRTPITSMFGILNLLKAESIPENLRDYYYHFDQMISQMNSVVNTLTLLGQSTMEEMRIKDIDILCLLDAEVSKLSNLPNFDLIDFKKSLQGNKVIQTDEVLLSILIQSLLSNAIIFREPVKGSIEISVNVSVHLLLFEVKDDGEGISKEIASKIFQMFYRGSEKSTGQGMGLYLVKKIVERFNGAIDWESTGGYTTFRVSIPLAPAPVS